MRDFIFLAAAIVVWLYLSSINSDAAAAQPQAIAKVCCCNNLFDLGSKQMMPSAGAIGGFGQ